MADLYTIHEIDTEGNHRLIVDGEAGAWRPSEQPARFGDRLVATTDHFPELPEVFMIVPEEQFHRIEG
jgi:hypothetical protein